MPREVPVLVETPLSDRRGPADTDQWWCQANWRPPHRDVRLCVMRPGHPDEDFIAVTVPADDLDEAEDSAPYGLDVARHIVRLINNRDDAEAWADLKTLLGPAGPMGGQSAKAWHRLLEWLPKTHEEIPTYTLDI
ncbi:hypothetical protein AB0K02_33235 [Streptomyces sp. NPDC049597]|uniref:hypothetical protein n=1 Tax=Streptomyces sp. NPDC049597 TaxID=3155276 RepID=UPI00343A23DD